MAHGQHRLPHSAVGRAMEHRIEERDERRNALQRKSLCPGIPRLKNLLEDVGANQEIENATPVRRRLFALEPLLNPPALRAIRDMHEFDADRSAIKVPSPVGIMVRPPQLRNDLRLRYWPRGSSFA